MKVKYKEVNVNIKVNKELRLKVNNNSKMEDNFFFSVSIFLGFLMNILSEFLGLKHVLSRQKCA
jgi:hypothetical protein